MQSATSSVNEPSESDESILNVLRETDEEYLATSAIAEHLAIGQRQTGGRLNELDAEGRIERRKLGRTHAWKLAPSELDTPVDPQLGNFIRWSTKSRQVGNGLWEIGKIFVMFGAVLMFGSLTATLQGSSIPLYTNSQLLAGGYYFLAVAVTVLMLGGLLQLLGIAMPRIAEWQLKKFKNE